MQLRTGRAHGVKEFSLEILRIDPGIVRRNTEPLLKRFLMASGVAFCGITVHSQQHSLDTRIAAHRNDLLLARLLGDGTVEIRIGVEKRCDVRVREPAGNAPNFRDDKLAPQTQVVGHAKT
jgi:hypothetical protein